MAFREQYKGKPIGFANIKESRYIRTGKHEESRRRHRAKAFNEHRDIVNSPDNTPENRELQLTSKAKEDRMTRLLRWKTERDKRKKVEQLRQKPAFVVGVVHHKIYSPVSKDDIVKEPPLHKKVHSNTVSMTFPKGITKATEKRLMNKGVVKNPTKSSVKIADSAVDKRQKRHSEQGQSIAPNDYKFKAPTGLPSMLFGRVAIQSMSPNRMSEMMSFSPMTRRSTRKSIMRFTVEDINNKECNTSANNEKEDADLKDSSSKESSIEEVLLKLSSEDDEKLNLSNSSNSNKDSNNSINESKMEEGNNETLNNSATKASQSNNNCSVTNCDSPISEPVFFSPYIVSSRGKSNARKEQQLRRGFSFGHSSNGEIPTKDTVMKDLNISVEDEERTARYFQFLLNRETDRLNEVCEKWTEVKNEPETTEDAQYQINQAIGQTNLLISKKFERFRGLVSDCETGKREMLVTCKDLQGFWDMMYMEIKDCDLRFEKLEKLRSRGWEEEEEEPPSKPIGKKKTMVRKKVVSKKSSSFRSFLAERKKKMVRTLRDGDNAEELQENHIPESLERNENSSNVQHKTRRSILASVNDKKFTPAKHRSSARSSLLCKVQLSETRINSPLAVIKISQMCKTPEIQLDNSISYVNSDQTPGKSILKQRKNSIELESNIKSTYKVNFDDKVRLDEIPVDEETQLKRDLADALARIDSLDFDQPSEEMPADVGKKLTFDDNSSEESEDVFDIQQNVEVKDSKNKSMIKVPSITVQTATPRDVSLLRRSMRRQNAVDKSNERSDGSGDSDEHHESVKVLRNRSITASLNTPKSRRMSLRRVSTSAKESEYKENKTPSKIRRKSSLKVSAKASKQINSKTDLDRTVDAINFNENNDKRRHSTRTVKFSEKDCGICTEDKPILPVTPHVRRSKTRLSEKKRSTSKQEDTSLETPEKPPARIRRSQSRKTQHS